MVNTKHLGDSAFGRPQNGTAIKEPRLSGQTQTGAKRKTGRRQKVSKVALKAEPTGQIGVIDMMPARAVSDGGSQPYPFNAATDSKASPVPMTPTKKMDSAAVASRPEPMAVYSGVMTGLSPRLTISEILSKSTARVWTPIATQATLANSIKPHERVKKNKFASDTPFVNARGQGKFVRGSTVQGQSGIEYSFSNTYVWGGGGAVHLGFGPLGERVIAKVVTIETTSNAKSQKNKDNLQPIPLVDYVSERFYLHKHGLLRDEAIDGDKAYLIMDYQPKDGCELMQELSDNKNISPNDYGPLIIYFLLQATSALQNVHKRGWVALDVKEHNFLATAQGKLIYADFGATQSKRKDGSFRRVFVGTYGYLAPEVLFALDPKEAWDGARDIRQAADIWSLAITVLNQFPDKSVVNFFKGTKVDGKKGDIKENYREFKKWHAEMTNADGTLNEEQFERLKTAPRKGTLDMLLGKYARYSESFFNLLIIDMMNPTLLQRRPSSAQIGEYVQKVSFTPFPDIAEKVKKQWLTQINTPDPQKEAIFAAMKEYNEARLGTLPQTP